jgi:hypothetical protein
MISGAFALLRQAYPSESVNTLLLRLQNSGVDVTDSSNDITRTRPNVAEAIALDSPTVPAAPTNFVATAHVNQASLSWTQSIDATGYDIFASNGVLIKSVGTVSSTTVATQAGVYASYIITAKNDYGSSSGVRSNRIFGVADPSSAGYALFATNGAVVAFGSLSEANHAPMNLNRPIVGGASDPKLRGAWAVAGDGGIFSYGNVPFYGSMGGKHLNKPIVGMAATRTGRGYWMVASDGGIFSFGDARFYGSMGGQHLNKPIVGMAVTATGRGYWLVASDGGIFSFGDARFYGSMGGQHLNKPVLGMAATLSGGGYWMVASDGGIFSFGDARFYGSTGGMTLNKPVVGMKACYTGIGYDLFASDGGIFNFGCGDFMGSGVDRGYTYVSGA